MVAAARGGWPDDMVLTAARSLLSVLGNDARATLAEHARAWSPSAQAGVAGLLAKHWR
jgi:hypothetical protein